MSIRILADLDLLKTDFGRSLVSAGLLCDVAGLATIGVLLNLGSTAGLDLLAASILLLKFTVFGMCMVIADRVFRYRRGALGSWILQQAERLTTKGAAFALPFLIALGFAFVADLLGLHFVVGAFFGTLLVAEHVISERRGDEVRNATSAITMGVFGPIFFAFIGLTLVASSLTDLPLGFGILGIAIAAKFLGGYAGARWAKLPHRQCVAMGFGMNGRGAMELVVATIGLELGFVDATLFSVLVLTGVVTTLMTPIGLKVALRHQAVSSVWPTAATEDPSPSHGAP